MYSLLLFLSGASLIAASPIDRYVVHESRPRLPDGWERESRLPKDLVLGVRIGLTQANLHRAEELLLQVSHPESPLYGKHWTPEEVRKTFTPSDDSFDAVAQWLKTASIPYKFDARGWVNFNANVSTLEPLLKAKYYLYEHNSGLTHIGCESYSVPQNVHEHIDIILPSVHFDVKPETPSSPNQRRMAKLKKRALKQPSNVPVKGLGAPINSFQPKVGEYDPKTLDKALSGKELYQFGKNHNPVKGNSYGIVEYTPQAYLQSDLDKFFGKFSPPLVGQSPMLKSIDGGYAQTTTQSEGLNGESDLDLEYAMALVYPQLVTLYQVGDIPEQVNTSFNNFLDAIDGSYCTYEGGDDPELDAHYPDPLPGGYKGTANCGTYDPTWVISTSYGYGEPDLTPRYEMRQCNEYMKLGLMGITVLYSSGDYGVAGYDGQCVDPATGQYNNGTNGRFVPDFPGGCPWITAVGGTQIDPGQNVFDPEVAWNVYIKRLGFNVSTSGGFSDVFTMPSYQAAAVDAYLAANPPPYTGVQYNNSGIARGFPDVAANAWNYTVVIDGNFTLIGGTSAASPTFGSIMTLINQDRLYHKKTPVGFINPVLYANPSLLHDITSGNNPGCGTRGFEASTGWDPVTGLGTPNFRRMREFWNNLP